MEKSTMAPTEGRKKLAWYQPRFSMPRKDFWGFHNLANPRVLFAIAAMAALGNVLGLLMIPIGPQAKLDLTSLPLLAIAYLFGPIPGFVAGVLGSLVTIPQFGHPFSPILWYGPYIFLCGIVSSRLRLLFTPTLCFLVLWPTLGYWMNVVFLRYPVAIWWVIFLKEIPMSFIYALIIESLLSSPRVRKVFTG